MWLTQTQVRLLRGALSPEVVADSPKSCLSSTLDLLCALQPLIDDNNRASCRGDATKYYQERYNRFQPSEIHLQARQMMRNLTALDMGSSGWLRTCNNPGSRNPKIPHITLCTDRDTLDLLQYETFLSLLHDRRTGVMNILSVHVLEHFKALQTLYMALEVFLILAPGGVWRIAVPDGYKPAWGYQDYVRPGGTPSGKGQKHMMAWNIDTLTEVLQQAGFDIIPREYFDNRGHWQAHSEAYEKEDELGRISRSLRHDHRNRMSRENATREYPQLMQGLVKDEPIFTSLWVDAVKPTSCADTVLDIFQFSQQQIDF